MKTVKCRSGLMGWQSRLQEQYQDFAQFSDWCDLYHIHSRLGYKTKLGAWKANPVIQGSTEPSDLCCIINGY